MSFDVSDPHSLTILLAGAFGGALLSLLFYAVTSPLRSQSQCEKVGKSWLTEVLTDGTISMGVAWTLVLLAGALVVAACAIPTAYYNVALLQKQIEEQRIEKEVAEDAFKNGYEQANGVNGVRLWRKAGSPTP